MLPSIDFLGVLSFRQAIAIKLLTHLINGIFGIYMADLEQPRKPFQDDALAMPQHVADTTKTKEESVYSSGGMASILNVSPPTTAFIIAACTVAGLDSAPEEVARLAEQLKASTPLSDTDQFAPWEGERFSLSSAAVEAIGSGDLQPFGLSEMDAEGNPVRVIPIPQMVRRPQFINRSDEILASKQVVKKEAGDRREQKNLRCYSWHEYWPGRRCKS